MEAGSSKLILGIVAAAVVVGVVAVRNLISPGDGKDGVEIVDEQDRTEADDSSGASGSSSTPETRVSSTNRQSRSSSARQPASGRTFNRGEGAAAIDVTPATTTTAQAAAAAVTPETTSTELAVEDQRSIADLAAQFLQTTDPEARIDIADELGLIDDPAAIAKLIELLRQENDPSVQAALLEAMQGLDALEMTSPEVVQAVKDIYARSNDPDVRIAAQDLLGDVGNADAANYLREIYNNPQGDPSEKLNAAENLMRLRAMDPDLVPQTEVTALTEQLKQDYQTGGDAAYRSQAVMALAIDGRNNLPFFQQALQTEQDPQLRTLLERLVRIFSQGPAATPPPGTVVTPVPQP